MRWIVFLAKFGEGKGKGLLTEQTEVPVGIRKENFCRLFGSKRLISSDERRGAVDN